MLCDQGTVVPVGALTAVAVLAVGRDWLREVCYSAEAEPYLAVSEELVLLVAAVVPVCPY